MALNYAIRRSTSRVAPLILSQRFTYHCWSSAAINYSSRRSFPTTIHRYSTKRTPDALLLRALGSVVKFAEEIQGADELVDIPEDFPFKMEDHPGQKSITLTREHQGETITAKVHLPNPVADEDHVEDDDDDEEGGGWWNGCSIPLSVKVSRDGGPILEFGCTAYPNEIAINTLLVKEPRNSKDQIVLDGPDFTDLDENLQKAFRKYLEIRGLKPEVTNILRRHLVDKHGREYIAWLEKIRMFVRS